jgi:hypothetical protein
MTLRSDTPQLDYIENGVTVFHAVPFQFQLATDILCSRIVAGVETPLVLGSDYNVTGGGGGGGTIIKTSGGVVGATFRVRRHTTRAQPADYTAHDDFPAEMNEAALDRIAAVNQEQDVDIANVGTELDQFEASTNANLANLALLIAGGIPLPTAKSQGYTTRAALAIAGAAAVNLDLAHLTEVGREGMFVYTTTNISAAVTADPQQGVFVAKSTDPSGASGGWVRKFTGPHNVRWFGAKGDGVTDDSANTVIALSYLEKTSQGGFGYGNGASELFFPRGHYYMGATTLEILSTVTLTGESVGEAGGGATVLRWAAGATGIRVQRYNTQGANGNRAVAGTYGGDASIIRNLFLRGGYTVAEGEYHGIHLRARAEIRDVFIENFQGDGIFMNASQGAGDGTDGNANSFEITKVLVRGCRNALWVGIADANAALVTAFSAIGNRAWGVDDHCFLGNTYVACHTSTNVSGPYRTTNLNAQTAFFNCYAEIDQPPCSFASTTIAYGGQLSSGVVGGAYLHATVNDERQLHDRQLQHAADGRVQVPGRRSCCCRRPTSSPRPRRCAPGAVELNPVARKLFGLGGSACCRRRSRSSCSAPRRSSRWRCSIRPGGRCRWPTPRRWSGWSFTIFASSRCSELTEGKRMAGGNGVISDLLGDRSASSGGGARASPRRCGSPSG